MEYIWEKCTYVIYGFRVVYVPKFIYHQTLPERDREREDVSGHFAALCAGGCSTAEQVSISLRQTEQYPHDVIYGWRKCMLRMFIVGVGDLAQW